MKHDEELVDRVAKALANASGTYHFTARAVLDALAPELRHDPPEGCEWVALPVEDVATMAEHLPSAGWLGGWLGWPRVRGACRDAVARRPKPGPRTERVPWWEAVGGQRSLAAGPVAGGVKWDGGELALTDYNGVAVCTIAPDGTVEVLAEDDQ